MTPKRVAVATHAGRRRIIVPDVEAEECSACGERLYDLAALRKIRVARKSVRPRARRAA